MNGEVLGVGIPVMGTGLGGSPEDAAIVLILDLSFWVGTALLFRLGGRLAGAPAGSTVHRHDVGELRS